MTEDEPTPDLSEEGNRTRDGERAGRRAMAEGPFLSWEGSGVGQLLGSDKATSRRPILRYNPKLKPFAKKLRRKMTLAEVLLWKRLNRRQVLGQDFDRQRPVGEWIVDFYCKALRLAIEVHDPFTDRALSVGEWIVDFYCKALRLAVEVDGAVHDHLREKDQARQRSIEALGVKMVRFWNSEVKDYTGDVVKRLEGAMRLRAAELGVKISETSGQPTPDPSQEGNRQRSRRASTSPATASSPSAALSLLSTSVSTAAKPSGDFRPPATHSPPRRG